MQSTHLLSAHFARRRGVHGRILPAYTLVYYVIHVLNFKLLLIRYKLN